MRPFPGRARNCGRSLKDLQRSAQQLVVQAGLKTPGHFVLVVLGHDQGCALHPSAAPWPSTARCVCEPDITAIVDPGAPDERLVDLLRDGELLLPIDRSAAARDVS